MNFNLWHRVTAAAVFLLSTIIFLMTVAPTISFWDCGEFITASVTMGVPHPPGAPFFQLVGRFFSLIPFSDDLGFRVNLISTFSSSLTVLFTYLVTVRLLRQWKGDPKTGSAALGMLVSAATGALILSFSDTFWFNASEAEVYGIGMFFISIVVWIAVEWYFHAGVFDSERSLLLIAYLMGLSIGVHLLSLLALFFVFFLIYFRDRQKEDINVRTASMAGLLMAGGFGIVYPGVVKYIPAMLSSSGGLWFLIILVAALVFVVWKKDLHPQFRMVSLGILLITLGYSTYALVPIRANQNPALNENAPKTLPGLYSYLNRDQYGSYPLLKGPNYDDLTGRVDMSREKFLPRRWNPDPENMRSYAKYTSDMEFFLSYQLSHIYLRYFMWNFVGRAGDIQEAPVSFVGEPGDWSESPGYPNRYYAIPFVLGLLGMFYHFRKDFRTGTAMAVLFFITGIGLVIYFNMAEPQVRERDYFFIGSFYVFALWAGLGVYSLIEMLNERLLRNEAVGVALAVALLVVGPGNMLANNYRTHDRHHNYVAFDYAYNLLQSCEQDGILFTGGDNDTFPVWYLQYAAGVRRDVRVINLSLLNTDWYMLQMKNDQPYGAKKVKMGFSDDELRSLRPMQWDGQSVTINVPSEPGQWASLKDMPQLQGMTDLPQQMQFQVNPTYVDPQGVKGLRNQDVLVLDILQRNLTDRPIYFALSTSPNDRVGLEKYLVVEGLAYRATPFLFQDHMDRYYANVNAPVTKRHLTQLRTEPDSNRAYGFMFRALDNPDINLDEASTKMIYSFRVLYMALSQVMYQDYADTKQAKEVIAKMQTTLPEAYHRFDPGLKTDLTSMFMQMGDTAGFLKLAESLEPYYLSALDKDITGQSTLRSPYRFLLDLYQAKKEFRKGVDLMKRYQKAYPNDPTLSRQIESWERHARGGDEQTPAPDTVQ